MKNLKYLLALLALVSFSASAAYGWHSGVACRDTAVEAAAEKCATFAYPLGSSNGVLMCKTPQTVSCATAAAGGVCSTLFDLYEHGTGTKTTYMSTPVTQIHSMLACDLGATPADKIADMSLLWGLFLGAAIVIWTMRKLLKLWESSPHAET